MNTRDRREQLYQLLVDAEALLMPPDVSSSPVPYRERVREVIDHGWDASVPPAPPGASSEPSTVPPGPDRSGAPSADVAESAPAASELSEEERRTRLQALHERVLVCDACPLSMGRTHAVPGEGVLDPLVMIVGEGPGYHEDREGRPFVGKAGQYLDRWLTAIGLARDRNVFIANIVKCRPPNNRDPLPEESDACAPYLREQIALVRPRIIVTVGRISTRILSGATQGITRIHGSFYRYEGIPLVPTFHPSAVLRNPAYRRPVWEDLKRVRNWLIDNAGHDAPREDDGST